MDFSKLSSNEKMAVYSSAVLVLAGIISNWGGLLWLSVLAGVAALVVIFLPQMSPSMAMPGSKGSLLVILGGIAAVGAVIELLRYLSYFFNTLNDWQTWLFAIALVASLVLLWTGWQMLQAEGGKMKIGMAGAESAEAAAPPPAAPEPPAAPSEPMSQAPTMSPPPSMGEPPAMGEPPVMGERPAMGGSDESDEDRTS